jgi:hypothetical protein
MLVPMMTQRDAGALEHILSILLGEPPSTDASADLTLFRVCFTKAGIVNASAFISMMEPNTYGSISFAINEDPQLNII